MLFHEFLPSSCILTVRFRSGIRYARVQTFFAGSVCTQWRGVVKNPSDLQILELFNRAIIIQRVMVLNKRSLPS
jgi:hypothetical protein